MKVFRNFSFLLSVGLFFFGCAAKQTNFSHLNYQIEPSIQIQKDPSFREGGYKSFTIIPNRVLVKDAHLREGIEEKQILFFVRNLYETLGYEYVEPGKKPDLVVSVDALTQYKEHYVPPQQITVPRWVPGQTYSTTTHHNGNFNANAYDMYGNSAHGYGNYSGTSTSYTTTPGYMTTETYVRPGYMQGFYYPSALINVFEMKSKSLIWQGVGTGTISNPDIRTTTQGLFLRLSGQFPTAKFARIPKKSGAIGVLTILYSRDGNSYYPTVLDMPKGSPAQRAGVVKEDMIVAINGKSTENMPITEFYKHLEGDPDTELILTVQRLDKLKQISVRRADRAVVYAEAGDMN